MFKSPLRQAGVLTPITLSRRPQPLLHFDSRFPRCTFVLISGYTRKAATMLFRFVTFVLLISGILAGQTPLRNSGEPMRLPFTCTEEEVQSVGLVCTEEEPCSIYLELAGIAIAGRKVFVAGNLHSSSATIASILLASDDGEQTWKEPSPRVRGAALEAVEFYDLDHGWAAGEVQYPLPRDSFFLVSTDGGSSWRQKPVAEDGGPGSLQRFWFDSAQHGEVIVDAGKRNRSGRYLDYESETGGDSWMLRSTTGELPKLKHAPASMENPDFRLRAADNGKAWEVEKRENEKWVSVASFLIEVATCKIKAAEAKEPPPEPVMVKDADEDKDYVEELKLGDPKAKAKPATPKTPAKKPGAPLL